MAGKSVAMAYALGMDLFDIALLASTLLCGLVAGFVFAFAIVVMPGIRTLEDRDYLRAFAVMDGVIQRNQPVFMLVWIGSIVAIVVTFGLGLGRLEGAERLLLMAATALYLGAVQLPTMAINVPLNNRLQQLNIDGLPEPELRRARQDFEPRWTRWNTIRTWCATATTGLLAVLLLRL